jgi:arylsulfatase
MAASGGHRLTSMLSSGWHKVARGQGQTIIILGHEDNAKPPKAAFHPHALVAALLNGWQVGNRTYRVHLDGYNQLRYLTGQQEHSDHKGFIYIDDDGQLVAIRYGNWKLVFYEQKTPGTLDIWGEPFTARRVPLIFNLRMDPCERAQITSNSYWAWSVHKLYLLLGAQEITAEFVASRYDVR